MKEIENYFFENLYILKDEYKKESFLEENSLKESYLKGVCSDCDKTEKCKLMSSYSSSEHLMAMWQKYLPSEDLKDFESRGNDKRVMFIYENPGTDWWGNNNSANDVFYNFEDGHFKTISFGSINYWFNKKGDGTDVKNFPNNKKRFYSPALVNLIFNYGIKNFHVTNSVKCKPTSKDRMSKDLNLHCGNKFLKFEILTFKPDIIFCFGQEANNNLQNLKKSDTQLSNFLNENNVKSHWLFHPSARMSNEKIKTDWHEYIRKYFNKK